MHALFDQNCNLVGWYDPANSSIWDTQMRWSAFIVDGNAFSTQTEQWLGAFVNATFQDRNGKAALWMPELGSPESGFAPFPPFAPFKPFTPFTPFKPAAPFAPFAPFEPLGGWSQLNFNAWMAQN
ncbi:4-fold beta flower protein [Paraburkholderia nodosa]|uniref:4-fold beta flower protein n=1 Tax=Paraburkholderia nodosa TaxID=392320 RepID=UPI0008416443|nr:hypothetical protein [Paraburkholderia nodosa]